MSSIFGGDYEFLNRTFWGNTVENYLWAVGILLVGIVFKKILSVLVSKVIYRIFKKYSGGVRVETFTNLLTAPVSFFILLFLLFLSFNRLQYPLEWHIGTGEEFGLRMILAGTFKACLIISITWIFLRTVDFFGVVLMHRARFTESKVDDMLVPFIKGGVKMVIAMVGFFALLGMVFKLNVVTLIGGLGIGGLAVALAARETLENLLGSVMIFLDKPFLVGDQVKVGQIEGIIDKIGFRSTRIRTVERSIVSVPNKKMMDAELENQTFRDHRRARFNIALTYDTPSDIIRTICAEITSVLLNHELVEKDFVWVRLAEFSPSSLDIQINFFVHTPDLEKFLQVREELNYRIVQIVKSNNGKFAFPSTTVYVSGEEKPATRTTIGSM